MQLSKEEYASLVMPNSDPRADFSIRISHSWKILIVWPGSTLFAQTYLSDNLRS